MTKPTNPVVNTTALRAYAGWTVRQYADGTYDAVAGVAVSPVFDTFNEAVAHAGTEARNGSAKRVANFVNSFGATR